jgi:hypothetical protein
LWETVLPFVLICGLLFGYSALIEETIGLPGLYYQKSDSLRQLIGHIFDLRLGALKYVFGHAAAALLYLGLFLLPLTALAATSQWIGASRRKRQLGATLMGALALFGLVCCWLFGRRFPMLPDQIVDLGIGLRSLSGAESLPGAPPWWWWGITALACVGAALLLFSVTDLIVAAWHRRGLLETWLAAFLALVAAALIAPMMFAYTAFLDRYLIAPLPFVAALVVGVVNANVIHARHVAPLIALLWLPFGAVAVTGVHDFFAWQRTAWDGAQSLHVNQGVPIERINATVAFNNWWRQQDPSVAKKFQRPIRPQNTEWVVSFAEVPGYETVRTLTVPSWAPIPPKQVLILRRSAKSRALHLQSDGDCFH